MAANFSIHHSVKLLPESELFVNHPSESDKDAKAREARNESAEPYDFANNVFVGYVFSDLERDGIPISGASTQVRKNSHGKNGNTQIWYDLTSKFSADQQKQILDEAKPIFGDVTFGVVKLFANGDDVSISLSGRTPRQQAKKEAGGGLAPLQPSFNLRFNYEHGFCFEPCDPS